MSWKKVGIVLFSTVLLTGCQASGLDSTAIQIGDEKITVNDVYRDLVSQTDNQQLIQQTIIQRVYLQQFGDKIKDNEIDEFLMSSYGLDSIDEVKEQLGDTYSTTRTQVHSQLAYVYGLEKEVPVTNEDLQKRYETYQPNHKALVLETTDVNVVTQAKEQLQAGVSFKDVVKNLTGNEIDEMTVSQTGTELIPNELTEKIFATEKGQTTDTVSLSYGDVTFYFLAQVTDAPEKDSNWKTYKDELTTLVKQTYLSEETNVLNLIQKQLEKANVKVEDKNLSSILDDFKSSDAKALESNTNE